MSTNRVAIISVNKFDNQAFQPKPGFPVQHKRSDDKHQLTKRVQRRFRCKFCQATFTVENNHRGSCSAAPDKTGTYIEVVTCVICMHAIVYHCMSDSDNEYAHPCTCDTSDESNCKKWTTFSILSICLPCMLFYWPLKACHKIAVACGCCGGRHQASRSDTVLDVI